MFKVIIGISTGLINGLLGGGAGLICVPFMRKIYKDDKKAHAYTVATVLASTIVSVIIYWINGNIDIQNSYKYLIGGIIAAPIGVTFLKKMNSKILRKAFAVFLIYSAVRMFINA